MGRKGITSADVVAAYVALLKQGRKPSLINLRLQLGWGSYASISQHLRRLALRQVALQAQRTGKLNHAQEGAEAPGQPTRLGTAAAEVTRL
ncbi:DNA-binding protein [Piscinibacter sp.]|jgi:hypothetical protein|uniref:DNA-binding protein n=1 Tax=Piscinibacter sp. TaxID=1903157 RepID=UPI001D307306|nr:DNA-binding protein [Piscinibacter sp.]MBK7532924.1 DNA-binding protein [Piscinibacter sp.]